MNMTPERWKRVEELFAAAKELSPAEAATFLRERCGDDRELEREVASLLDYHRASAGVPGVLLDASRPPAFLPVPIQLRSGDKLGPYEILASIGEGGMGEVYKARDTRLDRIVAIKVAKDQFTERFEREARLVAALNHPHVCQLYDVGPNYLVFEYIDGAPLKGPMPPAYTLRIALQIIEALEEAHKNGIIHRDLKPGNILLTTRGAKVLDFGLAKQ